MKYTCIPSIHKLSKRLLTYTKSIEVRRFWLWTLSKKPLKEKKTQPKKVSKTGKTENLSPSSSTNSQSFWKSTSRKLEHGQLRLTGLSRSKKSSRFWLSKTRKARNFWTSLWNKTVHKTSGKSRPKWAFHNFLSSSFCLRYAFTYF